MVARMPRAYLVGVALMAAASYGLTALPRVGFSAALAFWIVMCWAAAFRLVDAVRHGASTFTVASVLCAMVAWAALLTVTGRAVSAAQVGTGIAVGVVAVGFTVLIVGIVGARVQRQRQRAATTRR
jgi:uncharacterized membrane-anchored protein